MKKRLSFMVVSALLFGCGTMEKTIDKESLPPCVKSAVVAKFPGISITGASSEKEDGKLVYEINGNVNGKKIEIETDSTGKILEIE